MFKKYKTILLIILTIIIALAFYWLQIREGLIISQCQKEYDEKIKNLEEINSKYKMKPSVDSEFERDDELDRILRITGIDYKEWQQLSNDKKSLYEKVPMTIEKNMRYRQSAEAVYKDCLRRNGLER